MLLEAMKCLCKVFIYLHILKYVLSWTLKASENIPWILRGVFCLCNGWLEIFPRVYLSLNIKGNKSWIFIGRTDVKAEAPILWPPDANSQLTGKDPAWCWERLRAGVEGGGRGWDGWMASPTQWTWVWASSRRWWWTGKPGVLQSMGSQRVRHNSNSVISKHLQTYSLSVHSFLVPQAASGI